MLEKIYSYLTFDPKNVFRLLVALLLFFATFFVLRLFQNPTIFHHTLGKITHTYSRDTAVKKNVWKVQSPFYYRNSKNLLSWDAGIYNDIRYGFYGKDIQAYAFFPLFPVVWKVLRIEIESVAFFNYLFYSLAVLLLLTLFLPWDKLSDTENFFVFTLLLTLPMAVVFYLPYAEAVYTLTFALAAWALIKNKYWLYFIFMLLFAMSRPMLLNAGLAFLAADILFFMQHKNIIRFLKEAILKIVPLFLGTLVVFYIFYLRTGSFFKYFEAIEKGWNVQFRFPSKISDWSIEGFGMNVFSIFFVIALSVVILCSDFIKKIKNLSVKEALDEQKNTPEQIRRYLFTVSMFYFIGIFASLIFFQGGSLNGLCRYIFASPFFFIFLFYLFGEYNQMKFSARLLFFIPAFILSFLMLIGFEKYEPALNFSDSGYFTLLFSFSYLFFMKQMNPFVRVVFLMIIVLYNLIWIAYLYNMYLCNAWIYT